MLNSQCDNSEYTYRCERERELKVFFCIQCDNKHPRRYRSRIHVDR